MKTIVAVSISLFLSSFANAQNTPLRMAKIHGTLTKLTATYNPVSAKQEKICDLQADIPVFQSASGDELKNLPVCTSTVNGQPVKIYISADVEIYQQRDSKSMVKSAVAVMNIQVPSGDLVFQQADAGTLDLNLKTLLLGFSSSTFSSGQPVIEESFSADLTFDDSI